MRLRIWIEFFCINGLLDIDQSVLLTEEPNVYKNFPFDDFSNFSQNEDFHLLSLKDKIKFNDIQTKFCFSFFILFHFLV